MPCLFAAFEICHRSHSPLCSLFQIPEPTNIQVKIAQLMLSSLLSNVQKITSAENLRSRASDEIVPFREFIIKDDTSALL